MQMTWLWLCKCQWHVEKMISKCWTYQILMLLLVLLSDNLAVTTAPVSALYTSIFPLVVHGTKSTVAAEPCFRLFFVAAHLVWYRVYLECLHELETWKEISEGLYTVPNYSRRNQKIFLFDHQSRLYCSRYQRQLMDVWEKHYSKRGMFLFLWRWAASCLSVCQGSTICWPRSWDLTRRVSPNSTN